MTVIIGIDPHKSTHTAVAICGNEVELASITLRATCQQTDRLLKWAEPLGPRTWAIESAGGLGYLLSQQLVDAGERVVDVPATLASRVRVLGSGRSNKNDANDALSVAIAALRARLRIEWATTRSRLILDSRQLALPITMKSFGCWPSGTTTSGGSGTRW